VTGTIQVADIVGHLDNARRGQTVDYTELIDARGAVKPYLTAADIRHAADIVRHTPVLQKFGRRAVIVDRYVTYELTQLFATLLADHFPMAVFRNQRQAEEWLAGKE
jgi:hypothetical protein